MSTTAQTNTPSPLETHLVAVLAVYEHGPIPKSIPAYTGPASPEVTEILRAIDTIARRTQPAVTTALTTSAPDQEGGIPLQSAAPLSEAAEELQLLTAQVQDIARVCTAITEGDLSQRMTVPVQGGATATVKDVVNNMADRLASFAKSTLRVTLDANNGALGGVGLSFDLNGVWRELSDSVNSLSALLTSEVRLGAQVSAAIIRGDLSRQMTLDVPQGEILDRHASVNAVVELLRTITANTVRLAEGFTRGQVGGQMQVQAVQGVWAETVKALDTVTAYYTVLVRELIRVTTELSEGKITKKIKVDDTSGDLLELVTAVNQLVDKVGVRVCC